MKHLLLTTIAAVVLVGCGESQQSATPAEAELREAAGEGNIEAVKQHIAAGTDVNAKTGGETPLLWAAWGGHKEIVELLIAEGADVNAKNDEGKTALHEAAVNGHKEIAQLLIAKGADVNAKVESGPKQGLTPLDAANETNHPETADLLRKHGGKAGKELTAAEPVVEAAKPEPTKTKAPPSFSKIHTAAQMGMIELVKQHLAVGEDVNAKGVLFKGTPLHSAAMGGRKEVIELLIAKGADVNAKDSHGETPLDWAISQFQTKAAKLLRKHGGKTGEELKAEGK